MGIKKGLLAFILLAAVAGCYNDGQLLEQLSNQEQRLAALDRTCAQMNTNIASLQAILQALQDNDCVTSVAPISQAGAVIGYTLSFQNGESVTIYHGSDGADGKDGADGRDGADGSVPVIGAAQAEDGSWYWTLNGEWLLDENGAKVKAVGNNGADGQDGKDGQDAKDGQDGITPILKIEDGHWFVSVDGGVSWSDIGRARGDNGLNGNKGRNGTDGMDGKNGDTMFKSITQDGDNVYITLSDNTVLTIPRVSLLDISFSAELGLDNDTLVLPPMYDVLTVHYRVTSPTTEVDVAVVTSSDVYAYVIPDGEKPLEGRILIKTDDHIDPKFSKVLVIVSDKTSSILRTLAVQEAKLVRVDNDSVTIGYEGGNLDFHYQTNTPVEISLPDSAKTWCWQVMTKAQMADSTITIHVEPNTGYKKRRTSVMVTNLFGAGNPGTITFHIYQEASDNIVFADSGLKSYLVASGKNPVVDLNRDGEISMAEAAAVTSLGTLFDTGSTEGRSYTSFDEFQYFTGITKLPAGSFNYWSSLTSITLPSSIDTIDVNFKDQAGTTPSPDKTVFFNCPELISIKGKFASEDGKALIYNRKGETTSKLVKVCETVPAFYVPEGVDTIARYCFYHSKVRRVQFSKSLKVIGDCAFEHSDIEIVQFPLGDGSSKVNPDVDTCRVTTVYDRTFAHCYKLEKFEGARVNGKLKVCTEGDRVLYRDGTVYAYALGSSEKKVIIPDGKGITRLADCVFEMVSPEGNPLPEEQSKLTDIALPTGINQIGARTFYNQAALGALYFHGSAVPLECGTEALGKVQSDMWVYIPAGASVEEFAKKLNYTNVTTWENWNP